MREIARVRGLYRHIHPPRATTGKYDYYNYLQAATGSKSIHNCRHRHLEVTALCNVHAGLRATSRRSAMSDLSVCACVYVCACCCVKIPRVESWHTCMPKIPSRETHERIFFDCKRSSREQILVSDNRKINEQKTNKNQHFMKS